MLYLKAIQTCFIPRHGCFPEREFFGKKRVVLSFCKSNGSEDSDQEAPKSSGGDLRKQELLARIAMLQAQKVRLTDYLDERSAFLTQFADEANAEIDQIGENALKELDEAGARIMENIESRMQEFEESTELNKQEIEENEKKLADFEDKIEKDRNEWLFFKNLGEKAPVDKAQAKEEIEKIRELNKKSAGSVIRRNIYIALIILVIIAIVDVVVSSASPDWGKGSVLGVILVGLLTQLIYEQSMLSETDKIEQENSKE
ncbi:uncharacterized protein LOC127250888 [Andrographis paniculata]|uniref:uncharacterized protein LOC127250888 n=1 Tax=Andrographis paniculata TaxID=175694 RepID=UPI0021E8A60D|nr:uncharacterized protein LOC127250888 [Andrographis paniculata]